MSNNLSTSRIILEKGKAGYPALYLLSSEEARSLDEIRSAAKLLKRAVFVWTLTRGIQKETSSKYIEDTSNPSGVMETIQTIEAKSITVLKNFHHFLDDPGIQAGILNAIQEFKKNQRMLVILTPVLKLPAELEKEFALVDTSLPKEKELEKVLQCIVEGNGMKGDAIPSVELKKTLIRSALGLTTSEAENAFSLAFVRPKMDESDKIWDPFVVMEEKCSTLKKTGLLTFYPPGDGGMKQVGGMGNLKEWISKRRKAFTPEAKKFGLPAPKGILMVGPPGSGKSLGARAISEELGLPLLRCDMGRIFAGLVGASEENSRKVIQTAEAVSPCVLWLDEIEKGFAGSQAGSLDSGVGARVLGTFLTWMQEKTSSVFVYATANNVSALPPELLRKGRFDDTFSVMLPTPEERKEIFSIHLAKRGRGNLKDLNFTTLVKDTEGWSGAEIEGAITEGMFSAFSAGVELNMKYLSEALAETVPLSVMMRAQISAMEEWCKGRTRPANVVKEKPLASSARAIDA